MGELKYTDITDDMAIGDIDGEAVSIMKCKCGSKWEHWDHIAHLFSVEECPNCGMKYMVKYSITVYEVDKKKDTDED